MPVKSSNFVYELYTVLVDLYLNIYMFILPIVPYITYKDAILKVINSRNILSIYTWQDNYIVQLFSAAQQVIPVQTSSMWGEDKKNPVSRLHLRHLSEPERSPCTTYELHGQVVWWWWTIHITIEIWGQYPNLANWSCIFIKHAWPPCRMEQSILLPALHYKIMQLSYIVNVQARLASFSSLNIVD